jgi:hypothetical protein
VAVAKGVVLESRDKRDRLTQTLEFLLHLVVDGAILVLRELLE